MLAAFTGKKATVLPIFGKYKIIYRPFHNALRDYKNLL